MSCPKRTALLVIDVQQGLIDGPPAAWEAPGTLARINAAIALALAPDAGDFHPA